MSEQTTATTTTPPAEVPASLVDHKPVLILGFEGGVLMKSLSLNERPGAPIQGIPVQGVFTFIVDALPRFDVLIWCPLRSPQEPNRKAMQAWFKEQWDVFWRRHWQQELQTRTMAEEEASMRQQKMDRALAEIGWPTSISNIRPHVILDARALTIDGATWPRPFDLVAWKPWNEA